MVLKWLSLRINTMVLKEANDWLLSDMVLKEANLIWLLSRPLFYENWLGMIGFDQLWWSWNDSHWELIPWSWKKPMIGFKWYGLERSQFNLTSFQTIVLWKLVGYDWLWSALMVLKEVNHPFQNNTSDQLLSDMVLKEANLTWLLSRPLWSALIGFGQLWLALISF